VKTESHCLGCSISQFKLENVNNTETEEIAFRAPRRRLNSLSVEAFSLVRLADESGGAEKLSYIKMWEVKLTNGKCRVGDDSGASSGGRSAT
jgi:hypothetical protein